MCGRPGSWYEWYTACSGEPCWWSRRRGLPYRRWRRAATRRAIVELAWTIPSGIALDRHDRQAARVLRLQLALGNLVCDLILAGLAEGLHQLFECAGAPAFLD